MEVIFATVRLCRRISKKEVINLLKQHKVKKTFALILAFLLTMSIASLPATVGAIGEDGEERPNLSPGKIVTASSSYEIPDYFVGKDYINDGNTNTSWQSDYFADSADHEVWLCIDLGNIMEISGVKLASRAEDNRFFPEDYEIQLSADGNDWTPVVSKTGDTDVTSTPRAFDFEKTQARYVRVYITKLFASPAGKGYLACISEFEIYGAGPDGQNVNLALGRDVDASTTNEIPESSVGKQYINDGLTSSVWQTEYLSEATGHEEWVRIDLGENRTVSVVRLFARSADGRFFPEDYEIQVSSDGTEWKAVASKMGDTEITKAPRMFEFEPTSARYVRLYITKTFATPASRGYVVSIGEFEVYESYSEPAEEFDFILDKPYIWLAPGESDQVVPYDENTMSAIEDLSSYSFALAPGGDAVVDLDLSSGALTAKAYGKTEVTVTENESGVSRTCEITVRDSTSVMDNIVISVPLWRDSYYTTAEQFQWLKEAGVNVVEKHHNLDTKSATDDTGLAHVRKMMELALDTWTEDEEGLYVQILTGQIENALLDATDEGIRSVAERFTNYGALLGFHVKDEPGGYANNYARVIRLLAESSDPNQMAMINFLPGTSYANATDFAALLQNAQKQSYLSFDAYPFPANSDGVDEAALFSNFDTFRRASLSTGMKTGFYVQATGLSPGGVGGYRRPDEGVLRYHISSAMAYGFDLIQYYTWFKSDSRPTDATDYTDAIIDANGNKTELYDVAADIHHELHNVGEILVKLDVPEVYHTGSLSVDGSYEKLPQAFQIQPVGDEYAILSLMVDRETGAQYLMIVNKDFHKNATMSFRLSDDIVSLKELDKSTANTQKDVVLQNGVLTADFLPGEFRIYALPDGIDLRLVSDDSPNLFSGKIPSASDSYGKSGWYVYTLTDGAGISTASANGWQATLDENGAWLSFDLKEEKTFNRLDLYPAGNGYRSGENFPKNVTLYVSDNNRDWTPVFSQTDIEQPTTEVPAYRFDPVSARYVKVAFTGETSTEIELAEIALYDDDGSIPIAQTDYSDESQNPNLALNCQVEASDSYLWEAGGVGPEYLTDGLKLQENDTFHSAWQSDYTQSRDVEKWIQADLGEIKTINQARLYPRGLDGRFFPEDYQIQVSTDGESWDTVVTVTGDISTEKVARIHSFEDVDARYVRVYITKLFATPASSGYLAALSELEVYHIADTSAMKAAIESAVIYDDLSGYIENGQAEFLAALQAAKDLLGDEFVLQKEIDAAREALIQAMNALKKAAEKQGLEEAVANANTVDHSLYTEESLLQLSLALENAKALLEDENVSVERQGEVDRAAEALDQAVSGLVAKPKESSGAASDESESSRPDAPSVPSTGVAFPRWFVFLLPGSTIVFGWTFSLRQKKRT